MARDSKGSHSFTCHPLTNHTCLYSPAAEHHRRLAGTRCAYLWRDGRAELTWVPNFLSFAASAAELAHGEKSRTQSITQSLTHPAYLTDACPCSVIDRLQQSA